MYARFFVSASNISKLQPNIIGRRQCPPGWSISRNHKNGYLFHYVISGSGRFEKNGKTYTVQAGDMFILCPQEAGKYTASMEDPYDYAWINLDCGNEFTYLLQKDVIHLPNASRIFIQMSGAKDEPGRDWMICGLAYQLFALMASGQSHSGLKDHLGQTLRYIEENYASSIRISHLAERLGLDRSHFCRLFRQQTGMSPQEYLVSYRLEKAEEMLRNTTLSQKEICGIVGYGDVYNFSRMFKRKYGIAPGKYRHTGSLPPAPEE